VSRAASFRRGFAATFVLDVLARALGAVTLVVLVRGLPVASFAQYALLLALVGLVGGAAGGGVRMRYIRLTAERDSRGLPAGARPSFSGALATTVALILALAAVALLGAELAALAGGSPYGRVLVVAAAGCAVGAAASELVIAHQLALRRFALAGWIGVLRAASVLVVAVLVVETPLGRSPGSLLLTFAAGMLAFGLAACVPLIRADVAQRRFTPRALWTGREERWLTVFYVAAAGFSYVDILVAGALLSDEQIATLGATLRYLALALGAFPALNAILKVRTSQVDVVDSVARQREMLIGWLRRAAVPCTAMLAAGVALGPSVITLVDGGRYPGSHVAFQILLTMVVATYLTAPASNMLITQARGAWLAGAMTIALVVNLVGDLLVARPFGVTGIAVVSSAVYVLVDAATVLAALRGPRAARERSGAEGEPELRDVGARDAAPPPADERDGLSDAVVR
jgi:O-antigen/teichoic acid export membrane protein